MRKLQLIRCHCISTCSKVLTMKHAIIWLGAVYSVIVVSMSPISADEKTKSTGDKIFGTAKVVQMHLQMTDKQLIALTPKESPKFGPPGFGPPRPQPEGTHRNTFGVDFPWSQGNLTFDDKTYHDVGVRYKGNYTYMATARSLKKSLKIDLNKHVAGQKLDGLTMLNFNCGVSDPSALREAFSYAFFRDVGIPTPRTAFAELSLSIPGKYEKEYVGMYTLVEQVNKSFLKRHYQDGNGMLLKPEGLQGGLSYLGPNWKTYEDRYHPENPPTDEQQKRLMDFTKLISTGSDETFRDELSQYLDVDAFLKFIAANTLLSNLDSYLGYGHNYYLYLVPKTNQFVFIPWDLDLSLASWPAVGTPEQLVDLSIHHPHAGDNKLLDRILATKQYQERYEAILREMTNSAFTKKKLSERLTEIEQAIQAPIAKEAKAVAARKEVRGGNGFGMGMGGGQFGQSLPPRRFIDQRIASVQAQFDGKTKGFVPKSFGFGFGPPPFIPKK